ncbi:hypothetical protein IJT10_03335, partial [bacterium]|nr:hypothetical protein [bacterium]
MKRFFISLLISSLCCASCVSNNVGGESEENKVVVCTPFPDDLAIELADTFTADTGIKVDKILD